MTDKRGARKQRVKALEAEMDGLFRQLREEERVDNRHTIWELIGYKNDAYHNIVGKEYVGTKKRHYGYSKRRKQDAGEGGNGE